MDYNKIKATRITGDLWTSENIFTKTTQEAIKKKAINLGQGAATFEVPKFFFD